MLLYNIERIAQLNLILLLKWLHIYSADGCSSPHKLAIWLNEKAINLALLWTACEDGGVLEFGGLLLLHLENLV